MNLNNIKRGVAVALVYSMVLANGSLALAADGNRSYNRYGSNAPGDGESGIVTNSGGSGVTHEVSGTVALHGWDSNSAFKVIVPTDDALGNATHFAVDYDDLIVGRWNIISGQARLRGNVIKLSDTIKSGDAGGLLFWKAVDSGTAASGAAQYFEFSNTSTPLAFYNYSVNPVNVTIKASMIGSGNDQMSSTEAFTGSGNSTKRYYVAMKVGNREYIPLTDNAGSGVVGRFRGSDKDSFETTASGATYSWENESGAVKYTSTLASGKTVESGLVGYPIVFKGAVNKRLQDWSDSTSVPNIKFVYELSKSDIKDVEWLQLEGYTIFAGLTVDTKKNSYYGLPLPSGAVSDISSVKANGITVSGAVKKVEKLDNVENYFITFDYVAIGEALGLDVNAKETEATSWASKTDGTNYDYIYIEFTTRDGNTYSFEFPKSAEWNKNSRDA